MSGNDQEEELPEAMAVRLAKEWHVQKNPYSQQFSSLVHHDRPLLMELACYPDSLLSAEVIRRFGEGLQFVVVNGMVVI